VVSAHRGDQRQRRKTMPTKKATKKLKKGKKVQPKKALAIDSYMTFLPYNK
jgi:hypothetical protein